MNLDRICTVDISLATPIPDDANFDNVLILGPAPENPVGDMPTVKVYGSLEELTEMGVVTTGDKADPIGVAATVAFAQTPRPRRICVAVIDKEDDLNDVLEQALQLNSWFCVCPVGLNPAEVKQVIQWTETQSKICGYVDSDPEHPLVEAGTYWRSWAYYPCVTDDQPEDEIPAVNLYGGAVGIAVQALHYLAGEETWALKQIAAVIPSNPSKPLLRKLDAANFTFVLTVASRNVTQGGKVGAGEWIDVIRFRDWLQNDMQTRVVNMMIRNGKIPYTDSGISLVENQMLASLKEGQKRGGISPTEHDADGNEIAGFATSVPLAAELNQEERASRVLRRCRFSARLAGAIHLTEITGALTYDRLA